MKKKLYYKVLTPSLSYPKVFFVSVEEIASRHRDLLAHGGKTINQSEKNSFFAGELRVRVRVC